MKKLGLLSACVFCATSGSALADTAAPVPVAMTSPAMTGPLAANPDPFKVDTGYGNVYVTGAATAFGQWQTNPTANDHHAEGDLGNGQVFLNKTDGLVQFYLQAGAYSIPDIGTPYVRDAKTVQKDFGLIPEGYVKLAPTDNFSVEIGKLPTLYGNEYTFSFENMNIDRGLLWNQENDINRGIQANYSTGPLAFSLSLNDGFYSGKYSWMSGSGTWTIDPADSVTVDAGGQLDRDHKASFVTPVYQNNSQIYNAYFTHTSGPWTLSPTMQYTYVPQSDQIGTGDAGSTYGAGLYANYTFAKTSRLAGFSLPVRVEYIGSTGDNSKGAPNLLYGPDSKAYSFTVTPTYQQGVFFVRPELAYVGAFDTTPGDAFGRGGNDKSQTRLLIETGIVF